MQSLEVITGQTSTGKTLRAINRAHETGADIISADSRQMYKYLTCVTGKEIGTSQFTQVDETSHFRVGFYMIDGIKIWGNDLVTPDKHISSSLFVEYVDYILSNTINTSCPPIVVGGSYLYIQDLLYGISNPVEPDWTLRAQMDVLTVPELQAWLQDLSQSAFDELNNSDKHNPRRLMRRIEIALAGKNIQQIQTGSRYNIESFIGLRHATPELLEERIRARVHERFDNGAQDEISTLVELGYSSSDPGCSATGYAQLFALHAGTLTREEALDQWVQAEVGYAKRQWTFMKKNQDIQWELV